MSGSFAGVLLLLGLAAVPGGEEDVAARKEEAGRYLERGNAHLEAGMVEEALQAYRDAYDAYPSPKIYYNIAEAERELGRFVEAADDYQRVVDEVDPESPLVSAAEEKLLDLDKQLARISVVTDPEGAQVRVGDRVLGTSPVTDVRVEPGYDVEVAVLLGDRRQAQNVDLVAGESRAVRISLSDLTPVDEPPVVVAEEPITSKWWFWTAIGAGIVVAGTAVGVAVSASSGDDFLPEGELGTYDVNAWRQR